MNGSYPHPCVVLLIAGSLVFFVVVACSVCVSVCSRVVFPPSRLSFLSLCTAIHSFCLSFACSQYIIISSSYKPPVQSALAFTFLFLSIDRMSSSRAALVRVLSLVLLRDGGGLPVPPLISLISAYAEFVGEVSIVAGGRGRGSTDDLGQSAQFDGPGVICLANDTGKDEPVSVMISDYNNSALRRFYSLEGMSVCHSVRSERLFNRLCIELCLYLGRVRKVNLQYRNSYRCICADPTSPGSYFVSDPHCIYTVNTITSDVEPYAGTPNGSGCVDGYGDDARFTFLFGISAAHTTPAPATSTEHRGAALFATDYGANKLRVIDLSIREVFTVAGTGNSSDDKADGTFDPTEQNDAESCALFHPRFVACDPSTLGVVYITTSRSVHRFDYGASTLQSIKINGETESYDHDWFGVAVTPTGAVLLTCCKTHAVYTLHPKLGLLDCLTPNQSLNCPISIVVAAGECCAYISDTELHCLRRLTLSPHLISGSISDSD